MCEVDPMPLLAYASESGLRRARSMASRCRGDDDRKTRELDHRDERGIVDGVRSMRADDGVGTVVAEQERVSVGRCLAHVVQRDPPRGAGAIFDDDRLSERFAQPRPEQPRDSVAGAADGIGDEYADRARGIVAGALGEDRRRAGACEQDHQTADESPARTGVRRRGRRRDGQHRPMMVGPWERGAAASIRRRR
jgi:hypothetical protein